MPAGLYFVLKYFSFTFTFTIHLTYSNTRLQWLSIFSPLDEVITELDGISYYIADFCCVVDY
jgi:hypothetical protein